MFGAKTSSQNPLWAIRVLTLDYLIDGFIDSGSQDILLTVEGAFRNIHLTSSKFQPASNLITSIIPTTPWITTFREALVAIIPNDEASMSYALKSTSSFEYPVQAEVYAGPYLIRGLVMTDDKQLKIYSQSGIIIVKEIQINCLLPGAKLNGLQAPIALLASAQIQVLQPSA